MASPSDANRPRPVAVPGSLWPFVTAGATAVGLGTLGVVALRDGGPAPWTLVVLAVATLALAVLLLDLPVRTEVDATGLLRVCLLRRGHVRWDRVVAVERQRRRLNGAGTGGLVVLGRRGRWLLATSAEPPHVHEQLARLVAEAAPDVRMLAEPPRVTIDRG